MSDRANTRTIAPPKKSTSRSTPTGALSASEKMKLTAQQRAVRLQLYGLVRSLSYVVRLSDLKTAQHFRARLAWVLRRPHDIAKPLHGDLKELFDISGLWYVTLASVTTSRCKSND